MGTIWDDVGVDEFTPYKIFGDPLLMVNHQFLEYS